MPIDIDIAHVARLARIGLDAEAEDRYRRELGLILDHAARVQAADTDGVPPTAHPLPLVNAFREDVRGESLPRDLALAAAPETEDGYFKVPPALETE